MNERTRFLKAAWGQRAPLGDRSFIRISTASLHAGPLATAPMDGAWGQVIYSSTDEVESLSAFVSIPKTAPKVAENTAWGQVIYSLEQTTIETELRRTFEFRSPDGEFRSLGFQTIIATRFGETPTYNKYRK